MDNRVERLREHLTIPCRGSSLYGYSILPPGKREDSHRLLEKTYRELGFWKEDGGDSLVFHRKESTVCFAIHRDGVMAGTVSLFPDGREGLPLDCIYEATLEPLRTGGRKLVEVGGLVSADRNPHTIFSLFKLVHNYALWACGADDLLLTVHPRHSTFYRALFCMEVMGEEKAHPSVNGAPAVLLRMDLRDAASEMERAFPRQPEERDLFRYYYRDRPEDFPREIFCGRKGPGEEN